MNAATRIRPPGSGAFARRLAAIGLLPWLAACTPSGWADPTEWFGGRPSPAETVSGEEEASKPGAFPLIGNVPDEAPRPSPQYRRNQRTQGLLDDLQEVRYSTGPVTAEDAESGPPARTEAAEPRPVVAPGKPFPPGPEPVPPPRPTSPSGGATAAPPPSDRAAVEAGPPADPPTALPPADRAPISLLPSAEPAGPKPLAAPDPSGGWAVRGTLVGVIQFLDGSVTIDARDRSILRDIALLQQQRGGRIRVVGHASRRPKSRDPARHRLANFELSLGRARNVALAMMEIGVDPEVLQVVAASASEPAYEESLPTGEAGNRRVEIFLEY